jgi:hypothetical protein
MTEPQPMPAVRRRPIPGMASHAPRQTTPERVPPEADDPPVPTPEVSQETRSSEASSGAHGGSAQPTKPDPPLVPPNRRRPADYGATRLVNFRIPVDLHDRYRHLVREAELSHPRLRRPSLTELVIALLEEGPTSSAEVAEMIRRKREAEHRAED